MHYFYLSLVYLLRACLLLVCLLAYLLLVCLLAVCLLPTCLLLLVCCLLFYCWIRYIYFRLHFVPFGVSSINTSSLSNAFLSSSAREKCFLFAGFIALANQALNFHYLSCLICLNHLSRMSSLLCAFTSSGGFFANLLGQIVGDLKARHSPTEKLFFVSHHLSCPQLALYPAPFQAQINAKEPKVC